MCILVTGLAFIVTLSYVSEWNLFTLLIYAPIWWHFAAQMLSILVICIFIRM